MEANPVRVIQYFDGTKQSLIPLFQRAYTWDTKNWQTLWDDIVTQYELDAKSSHFMGAVVSFPVETVPVGVNKHLIIDGQQRLTTIAILLCAIRDSVDEKTKGRIEDYLVNRHYEGADHLKLVPTNDDREAFSNIVEGQLEGTVGHRGRRAYDFFAKRLKDTDSDDNLIDVRKVLTTIEHCLQVVMINLGDTDDPYLIFESLNYKGEPLTQADLVRNYVLMRFQHSLEAGGEQERIYKRLWKPLQDSLDASLTEFLRHYSMKDGSDVKRGGIYAALKSRFKRLESPADVESELVTIQTFASFYARFVRPDTEPDSAIRSHLDMLQRLDVTTCYPLLLTLFQAHAENLLSTQDLVKCLGDVESFVVRRAICGVPTNSLNKLFVQWSRDFNPQTGSSGLRVMMAEGAGGKRWPKDQEFRDSFSSQAQYGKKTTRHILVRIERNFQHKEVVDLENATIEHLMPVTPEFPNFCGRDFRVSRFG